MNFFGVKNPLKNVSKAMHLLANKAFFWIPGQEPQQMVFQP